MAVERLLLVAALLLGSVSAQFTAFTTAEYNSKEKRPEMLSAGSEIFKVYYERDAKKPLGFTIPSTKSQKILAAFADLSCNHWLLEVAQRLPSKEDKQQALSYAVDLVKGPMAVKDIFKMGKNFESRTGLQVAFRYLTEVCNERKTGILSEVKEFETKETFTVDGKSNDKAEEEEEEDSCPTNTDCGSCVGDLSCVWCEGNAGNNSGYCTKGDLFGPRKDDKKAYPVSGPPSDEKGTCSHNYKYAFCQKPCSEARTCDACVSQPLCVWCPQDMSQMNATDAAELAKNGMPWGGKCSEGNRHGFNNGEKCEQGIIALHKRGFEKCPAAQKMPDVDGGFSEWSEWSQCQKSGVLGKCSKTRSRKCDNPAPLGRGKPCVGKRQEIKSCSNVECELSPETVEIKNAELNIKAKEIKVDKAENATLMAKEAITRAKGAVNQARLLGNTDKLEEAQDHLQDAEMNLLKAQHDAKEAHFAVDGAKYRLAVAKAFNCRKHPKAVNVAAQSSVTATNCIRATNCGPQLVDGTKDFNGLDWHTADRKRRGAAVTFDFGLSKVYGITGMNVYNQNSGHGWDVETVQVQKSSDGFKFTNVTVGTLIDSKGAVPNPVNSITFPETKSRFWRLVLNSFYSSDHGEYAGLMEVELLAKVQCETNTSVTDSESLARTDRD